jgi:hypothetical protein
LVDDVDAFAAGLYATPATFTPHRVAPLHQPG